MKTYEISYKWFKMDDSGFETIIVEAINEKAALKKAAKKFSEDYDFNYDPEASSGQWIIDKNTEGTGYCPIFCFRNIKEVRVEKRMVEKTCYITIEKEGK